MFKNLLNKLFKKDVEKNPSVPIHEGSSEQLHSHFEIRRPPRPPREDPKEKAIRLAITEYEERLPQLYDIKIPLQKVYRIECFEKQIRTYDDFSTISSEQALSMYAFYCKWDHTLQNYLTSNKFKSHIDIVTDLKNDAAKNVKIYGLITGLLGDKNT